MTIEEKARAYDEAKARMSRAFNSNRCTIGFMNEIFPDLKESEDERIRKCICLCLEECAHNDIIRDYEKDRCLVWLEKQKTFDYECANIKQKDFAPNDEEMKELLRTEYEKGKYDAIVEEKLWKPADGDDLPEYEREVVVLRQPGPLKLEKTEYCVSFAHRPDPEGWDGKSMLTGKIEHYTPKTYGKGGWNIPDVMWWLDCDLPNES